LGFQGGLDVHDAGGPVPETHLAALFVLAQVAGDGLGVAMPGLEGELDLLESAIPSLNSCWRIVRRVLPPPHTM
jgi:hypothetical protein